MKRFFHVVAMMAGVLALSYDAAGQVARPGQTDPQVKARVDRALEQLLAEARDLEKTDASARKPSFTRPHPALRDWGADMAPAAIEAIGDKLTGNDYLDAYVRWHLLAVAAQSKDLDPSRVTGTLEARLKALPEKLAAPYKDYARIEPEDVHREWYRLYTTELRITVGYPPFQKYVDPPESLELMEPARRAEAQKIWTRVQQLRQQWKITYDQKAIDYNERVGQLNHIARQYAGELAYQLLRAGEPQGLAAVTTAIGRHARTLTGFDLLNYMYNAWFDGHLGQYSAKDLAAAGRELETAARAVEKEWVRQGNYTQRNFAEYAFHMVESLKAGDVMGFTAAAPRSTAPSRSPARRQQVTPDRITTAHLDVALDRARRALYENESLQPDYRPMSEHRGFRRAKFEIPQEDRHPMGNHALICWAMLGAGESYQNPALARRIHWVLSGDASQTYDRGMRLAMLANLPKQRWGPWINRDAKWFQSSMTEKGNFADEWFGARDSGYGDNANGQYAALGLWVYERAGFALQRRVWENIDKYWREAMIPTPGEEAAGWAVLSHKVQQNKQDPRAVTFAYRVSSPMTAGGVATLCVTERVLHGDKPTRVGEPAVSIHLRKGLRWLDENFRLDDPVEDSDPYYYYWTIQRVGAAAGYRSFNGVDWFSQVTAKLINEQQPDGTWQGGKGRLLSTGFAMLYLSQAFDNAVAVGKLRFTARGRDGKDDANAWNNRPHDIWNFTGYISDDFEYASSWQIVDLDLPVPTLMEAPIIYLSTDKQPTFSDSQLENLRGYLNAGGLLLTNPDVNSPEVARGIKELEAKLLPGRKLENVPKDHEIYQFHRRVQPALAMQMVSNGIRPLWIHFTRDIGAALQTQETARSDSFAVMSNIYLYATGRYPRRRRLEDRHLVRLNQTPRRQVNAVRLRHSGEYDPEPVALTILGNLLANVHDVSLNVEVADQPSASQRLAFLTTIGDGELSPGQVGQIQQWLAEGGTLWLDAAGGGSGASQAAEAMLRQIAPDATVAPLSLDHPILSGRDLPGGAGGGINNRRVSYRGYALKSMGPVNTARLECVEIDGRIAIIFSRHDITCGLAGLQHWGIFGYSPESARGMVINSVLQAAAKP